MGKVKNLLPEDAPFGEEPVDDCPPERCAHEAWTALNHYAKAVSESPDKHTRLEAWILTTALNILRIRSNG